METFVIEVNGVDTDITRNKTYTIKYVPESRTEKTPITVSGIVQSLSTSLRELKIIVGSEHHLIPVKSIRSIEAI